MVRINKVFWAKLKLVQAVVYGGLLGFFQVRTKAELFYVIVDKVKGCLQATQ